MSFLDSVLTSIETGKPSPIPTTSPAPSPTIPSSTTKLEARKPTSAARPVTPVAAERKNGVVPAGTKRKAEEPLARVQKPAPSQGPTKPAPVKRVNSNTPTASSARPIAPLKSIKPPTSSTAPAPQKSTPVSSKPPPKGSFAEIMAKAKALQQTAPTQVGMFKHQSVPKEKLSKIERKKRMMEAQAKEKDPKQAKKPGAVPSAAATGKLGNTKVAPKREREEPTYKGTARPPPPQPEYRGTAGLPSRNGDRRGHHRSNKRSRMDEYLGTDEEDEGEYANEYDDYYSESSDMEAGFGDVDEEEAAALAAARREDIEDMRAEAAAKQEKLERRKKLAMLASKRH
ncbi:hypothetical protein ASPCAL00850 [Aspergillus calidoustus]|uniref:Chromatin SPT2 n=1 Tax=Aspergillus calidoustus TaxID=454130 RepID=A0A0U5FSM7_ASPCI|nr:hypothetical protein ASPCAL00850 [Aspergillus calidoustus]